MKNLIILVATAMFLAGGPIASADPAAGESLFNGAGKCKKCHRVTAKKKVGPGLAGVLKRTTQAWVKTWLSNPQGTWEADEGYTKEMKTKLKRVGKKKTRHKTKALSEQEVADIIDYLKTL